MSEINVRWPGTDYSKFDVAIRLANALDAIGYDARGDVVTIDFDHKAGRNVVISELDLVVYDRHFNALAIVVIEPERAIAATIEKLRLVEEVHGSPVLLCVGFEDIAKTIRAIMDTCPAPMDRDE